MKEIWNEKYSGQNYHYGKEPNEFYKSIIDKLQPGKILFLGEGEGRNAVYAAKLGWDVDAVDYSETGREKALKLAVSNQVKINYHIDDVLNYMPSKNCYDAVVLIFFHLDEENREIVHTRVVESLKKGGALILEAFDKEQIKNDTGGPKNLDYLYSLEDIYNDFHEFDLKIFSKDAVILSEGMGHPGESEVIRFHGIKIK